MHRNKFAAALVAIAGCFAASAHAVDSVSVEAGDGYGVEVWRLGAQWKWQKKWPVGGGTWHVGGYWDAQIGRWKGASNITDLSLTPVFRLEENTLSGMAPYVEAAIGFHYLSGKRVQNDRTFSTNFQFGDHLGAGLRFGENHRHDMSLRFQHLSNAGIRSPNPGVNFWQVRYQYHFN